jgi:Fe2+ or Zn2+ uptake regulation protein
VIAVAQSRMSAADVYERARRRCPDLGLATVYRTLEILDELGVIRRVHMDDNCESFAPAAMTHGHHVICTECGRVREFEGCDIAGVLARAARQTGFQIEEHWLELMGVCSECRPRRGA